MQCTLKWLRSVTYRVLLCWEWHTSISWSILSFLSLFSLCLRPTSSRLQLGLRCNTECNMDTLLDCIRCAGAAKRYTLIFSPHRFYLFGQRFSNARPSNAKMGRSFLVARPTVHISPSDFMSLCTGNINLTCTTLPSWKYIETVLYLFCRLLFQWHRLTCMRTVL